ncbi:MAG: hypothetical protein ACR2OG_16945 [Gemmatimonadaceae bacterium]
MTPRRSGITGVIDEPLARRIGIAAVGLSLCASFVLMILYRELGGPGDQLVYYQQATKLLPFNDNYYGPVYFVLLRVVHDTTRLGWFASGKLLSWFAAIVTLFLVGRLLLVLLPRSVAWLSLALIAANPTFIGESYSALTSMLGAAMITLAICLTVTTSSERPQRWFAVGVMFGVAALTRFQANGFLLGAIAGAVVFTGVPWRRRVAIAAAIAVGAILPVIAWNAFLKVAQGYTPPNYNFVHLTNALGKLQSFSDVDDLIRTYRSTWGVLTSGPLAMPRIAAYALKEAVVFPFFVGLPLLFVAAGFLLPGAVRLLLDKRSYAPWLGAYLSGFLLTGIGSMRWLHYYLAVLPFLVLLVAYALDALAHAPPRSAARIAWVGLLVSTFAFSLYRCRVDFLNRYWPEFTVARQWIERAAPNAMVSATAGGLRYGSMFRFIDLDRLMTVKDWPDLVPRLRKAGVTHLVISARHGTDVYPQMDGLLLVQPTGVPAGLQRDTLIVDPQPLAIYRVLPPSPPDNR